MARLGRIVAAGFPHHVTQRGNRRQTIFFEPADYALYRDLLAERCRKASVEVWAYCLMPNHVHLVLTPTTSEGLAQAIGEIPLLNRIGRFCDLIDSQNDRFAFAALRASETTGRALGSGDFVATLERATGRRLRPKKPGRKPSAPTNQLQLRMRGMNSEA
jgi:hypothetical protein